MSKEVGAAIDEECFDAMRAVLAERAFEREDHPPAVRVVSALTEDYGQAA